MLFVSLLFSFVFLITCVIALWLMIILMSLIKEQPDKIGHLQTFCRRLQTSKIHKPWPVDDRWCVYFGRLMKVFRCPILSGSFCKNKFNLIKFWIDDNVDCTFIFKENCYTFIFKEYMTNISGVYDKHF